LLLRSDAAKEGQVLARPVLEVVQVQRQAVVDRPDPVGEQQWCALGVGNGDERLPGELAVDRR
jgi:hypothetical protein